MRLELPVDRHGNRYVVLHVGRQPLCLDEGAVGAEPAMIWDMERILSHYLFFFCSINAHICP
jgi:hypothetical protein